jgi:hypothetical protein
VPKETDLRDLVQTLDPKARDDLRRVLIRDQADRDAIASLLMRYRDENGQRWADIIDFLTMYPDARRRPDPRRKRDQGASATDPDSRPDSLSRTGFVNLPAAQRLFIQ